MISPDQLGATELRETLLHLQKTCIPRHRARLRRPHKWQNIHTHRQHANTIPTAFIRASAPHPMCPLPMCPQRAPPRATHRLPPPTSCLAAAGVARVLCQKRPTVGAKDSCYMRTFERAFESVPPPPPQATAEAYPGSHSLDSTAPFQATRPLAKRKSQSIRPDDRPLPARDPGCVPIPTLHSNPEILPLNLSPGPKGP